MNDLPEGISVIRFDGTDRAGVDRARQDIREAFAMPQIRLLFDMTPLETVDGALLAAMFVACKSLPVGGRIALLASEDIVDLIKEWGLDGLWACFTSTDDACTYLSSLSAVIN